MHAQGSRKQFSFYETYYQPIQGRKRKPVTLFCHGYNRSMVVSLYDCDGKPVIPGHLITLISCEGAVGQEKARYNKITGSGSFVNCEAAAEYLASHESENWRIVSTNLLATSVPLEGLKHYKLGYRPNATEAKSRGACIIAASDKESDIYDSWIKIPKVDELLYPMVAVVPLQLLAYYLAINRGHDPDKPRNLVKSVTVK